MHLAVSLRNNYGMGEQQIDYIFQLGALFERVQMESVFTDSKTFVDCIPLRSLNEILDSYETQKDEPGFSLKEFVLKNFDVPQPATSHFQTKKNAGIKEHIARLWPVLTKESASRGSLIGLPKPFVVPGGRFRELFYWDSYFTMLGLQVDGHHDLIESMVENFAWLIDQYGYIPNGNRTYFLGRSQPPFFSLMAALLAEQYGSGVYQKYFSHLIKEHVFWMQGEGKADAQCCRTVHTGNGTILNRYWDSSDTPRPEAFKKDMLWVEHISEPNLFFRHERAACESGWDFSTRWLADGETITSMNTADLLPVDLNCLLWHLEKTIAENAAGDAKISDEFHSRKDKRKKAIDTFFWNEEAGFYFDYNFCGQHQTTERTLAAAFPLFFKLSTDVQAKRVADILEHEFLKDGGFVTTLKTSGQQWDAPNGWAPLEWITIKGLVNYGYNDLAKEAARRWMHSNEIIFGQTGKLMEKYNVATKDIGAMPGTYPTQDGFGWTNGVYLALDQLIQKL